MQIRYYRVGDHPLSICFARDDEADQLLPSFARFRLDTPPSDPLLLRVDVDDRLPWDEPHHEVGHFDSAGNMYGVYLRADGGYQYEINIHLGMTSVKISATVKPWEKQDAVDVNLPSNQEPDELPQP